MGRAKKDQKNNSEERPDYQTRFQKGNTLWKLGVENSGRIQKIKTPEALWKLACEYFEHIDESPFIREKQNNTKDGVERFDVTIRRPYTKSGLAVFCGVHTGYFSDLKNDKPVFSEILKKVDNIIYNQKFEGATIGDFKPQIIALSLGLKSRIDVTTKDESLKDGQKSEDQLNEELNRLLKNKKVD